MVHHLVLCKTVPELEDERVEWMLRETRIRLLKIGEVLALTCGKRIEPGNEWNFFFAADYESMEKMALGHADPVYLGFLTEVVQPHVGGEMAMSYELEPGKNIRYS